MSEDECIETESTDAPDADGTDAPEIDCEDVLHENCTGLCTWDLLEGECVQLESSISNPSPRNFRHFMLK